MVNLFSSFFLSLLLAGISPIAFAQSFSFTPPTQPSTTTPSSVSGLPPVSRTVTPPSDFSKQVSDISAQKQADFKKQLDQQLAAPPAPTISQQAPAQQTAPNTLPAPTTSAAPPASKKVYTGFGNGSTGNTGSTSTPSPSGTAPPAGSGTWNIHY